MASKDEVREVARLARLSVDAERVESLTSEFNSIISYVKALDAVPVTEVEPMSHVHGSVNVFREDVVVHSLTTEQALQNAPDRQDNAFRVPLVIDQSEEG